MTYALGNNGLINFDLLANGLVIGIGIITVGVLKIIFKPSLLFFPFIFHLILSGLFVG